MIIKKMGRYVPEEKVIIGSKIGDKVYIHRLSLTPSDTIIPFKFQRVAISRVTLRGRLKILLIDEDGLCIVVL